MTTTRKHPTTKNGSKALEEMAEVRRGLLDLARALLHAASTTLLAATGALVVLVDVTVAEVTRRVRRATPGGEPAPAAGAHGGARR